MLAKESRRLNTFITPWGQYYFSVLPYSISSESEKFQKSMSQILEVLEGVQCNIDDVLKHAPTQSQHDATFNKVLQRLSTASLTLNAAKCEFNMTTIKFLGHIISTQGIQPDPNKVSAVVDMLPPKNVHESYITMESHDAHAQYQSVQAPLPKTMIEPTNYSDAHEVAAETSSGNSHGEDNITNKDLAKMLQSMNENMCQIAEILLEMKQNNPSGVSGKATLLSKLRKPDPAMKTRSDE
ncbi:uncharacterized protein LOC111335727 [Stylophora pistillata]|uniref:uncharacterized protein LOC111335727 n=1 Tax=Stylophora pistillata TaxID=50429 RepID=UPI000C045128|nr:uncharacterized protein LOC111335727 [Stylophora pistillata]